MEQDYFHEGGAHDSETLYLFKEQIEDSVAEDAQESTFW